MNIFGIGPLEIIFILIIGILVLGPEGMVETGRKLGKFLRSIIRSNWWQNVRRGVNEIQHLPQKLIREAELEELNELTKITKDEFPKIANQDLLQNSTWAGKNRPDDE
jgi:Sec-independent protein translocase protein TatA